MWLFVIKMLKYIQRLKSINIYNEPTTNCRDTPSKANGASICHVDNQNVYKYSLDIHKKQEMLHGSMI